MDPFVAEVRIMGFQFAPKGWAFCNGQLMSISQNTALFSLLGVNYGGDGRSTFGLPNFTNNAAPVGAGQGPGLSERAIGEIGGEQYVTLLTSEMPMHTHPFQVTNSPADVSSPTPTTALARSTGKSAYAPTAPTALTPLQFVAVGTAGGSMPHNNQMPYQALNYCIALQGIFPQRP
jgi:microcystin-dependent protein